MHKFILFSLFLFAIVGDVQGQEGANCFKLIEEIELPRNPLFDYKGEYIGRFKESLKRYKEKDIYTEIRLLDGKSFRVKKYDHILINLEQDRIITLIKRRYKIDEALMDHFVLLIYDTNGGLLYESEYPVISSDVLKVKINNNGELFAVGIKVSKNGHEPVVRKFNKNGKLIWSKKIPGLRVVALEVSTNGLIALIQIKGFLSQGIRFQKYNYAISVFNLKGEKCFVKEVEGFFRDIDFSIDGAVIFYSAYTLLKVNLVNKDKDVQLRNSDFINSSDKVVAVDAYENYIILINGDNNTINVFDDEFKIKDCGVLELEKLGLQYGIKNYLVYSENNKTYLKVYTNSKICLFELNV